MVWSGIKTFGFFVRFCVRCSSTPRLLAESLSLYRRTRASYSCPSSHCVISLPKISSIVAHYGNQSIFSANICVLSRKIKQSQSQIKSNQRSFDLIFRPYSLIVRWHLWLIKILLRMSRQSTEAKQRPSTSSNLFANVNVCVLRRPVAEKIPFLAPFRLSNDSKNDVFGNSAATSPISFKRAKNRKVSILESSSLRALPTFWLLWLRNALSLCLRCAFHSTFGKTTALSQIHEKTLSLLLTKTTMLSSLIELGNATIGKQKNQKLPVYFIHGIYFLLTLRDTKEATNLAS